MEKDKAFSYLKECVDSKGGNIYKEALQTIRAALADVQKPAHNKQRDAIVLAINACRDAHAILIDSSEIEYIADAVYAVVAQRHPL